MATQEDILRKIRNALAKADSTDSPHEAEVANQLAMRLMTKFQIDHAQLVHEDKARRGEVVEKRVQFDRCAGRDWKLTILDTIAKLHHGMMLDRPPRNRTRYGPARPGMVHLIANENDIVMIEALWTSLLLQMDTEASKYVRSHSGMGVHGKTLRTSFLAGWATRVNKRLRLLYGEEKTSTGVEMVLVSKKRDTEQYLAEHFPNMQNKRVTTRTHEESAQAGSEKADRADLGSTKLKGERKQIG